MQFSVNKLPCLTKVTQRKILYNLVCNGYLANRLFFLINDVVKFLKGCIFMVHI